MNDNLATLRGGLQRGEIQEVANHKVATPAQWKPGDKVIIAGSVTEDEARQTYPDGWESPRPYIRIVPQPSERPLVAS